MSTDAYGGNPTPPPPVPYGGGGVNASASVQAGDVLTTIPFDSSALIPLIKRGYLLDPGDNGGALVFKKSGLYEIQILLRACVLGGGVGLFELFEYNNGVKSTARDFATDVDFANDRKNVVISYMQTLALSQASIDAAGGSYSKDFRVKTSDASITWRYGNSSFTSGQAASFNILRLSEYYI